MTETPPRPLDQYGFEELLDIALAWLQNVGQQPGNALLAAQPQGAPGLAGLERRLRMIRHDRTEREQGLAERRRLLEEQRARNASGAIRTRALRPPRAPFRRPAYGPRPTPGWVGVVEVRDLHRRWLRWTCPHHANEGGVAHPTKDEALRCAEVNRSVGAERSQQILKAGETR